MSNNHLTLSHTHFKLSNVLILSKVLFFISSIVIFLNFESL
ncbi:MAG: hypothetical protein Q8S84_06255 [bacterium]|nr:hypothetical protein [bacterium]MDP3381076.1 hypothetical protein [bacterium]